MRRRLDLRNSSGALAVEFALVAPSFLILLIGGFQVAWAMHCAASVKWSLETSARNLMFNPAESAATLRSSMVSLMAGRARADDLTVAITSDTSNPAGRLLVASSIYRTRLVIPFLPDIPMTFNASTSVPSP